MARRDYCPVGNEPCQSMCDEPCSWQGSTRKDDTVLIRQLVEALEGSIAITMVKIDQRNAALIAGRARLEGRP